jgi:hypothetical protein
VVRDLVNLYVEKYTGDGDFWKLNVKNATI